MRSDCCQEPGCGVAPRGVEVALGRHPGVREVAVTTRRTARGCQHTAWIVREKAGEPDAVTLRRALRRSLPAGMATCSFAFLDALSHTAEGRVDRTGLGRLDEKRSTPSNRYSPPRGEAEEKVASLFAEVLGVEFVGVEDDFFDFEGGSSDAAEAIVRLSEEFGRELETAEFLRAPTPAALALRMTGPPLRTADPLVPLRRGNGLPVFLFPAPNAGSLVRLAHWRLAHQVKEGRPIFAFDPCESAVLPASDLAEVALRTLRVAQPRGPYALVGECAAGTLAWEVARRLSDENEFISLLVLLDSPWRPHWRRRLGWPFRWNPARWCDDLLQRGGRHLRALRNLSVERWPAYLWEKGVAARATARRVRRPEVAERRRRRERYAEALGAIPLERWSGRLHFVQSADPLHERDAEGWATLAGSFEVVRVPVEHRMLLGDHVDHVAAALSGWLRQT